MRRLLIEGLITVEKQLQSMKELLTLSEEERASETVTTPILNCMQEPMQFPHHNEFNRASDTVENFVARFLTQNDSKL